MQAVESHRFSVSASEPQPDERLNASLSPSISPHQLGHTIPSATAGRLAPQLTSPLPLSTYVAQDSQADPRNEPLDDETDLSDSVDSDTTREEDEEEEDAESALAKFDKRVPLRDDWKSGDEKKWLGRIDPEGQKPEDVKFTSWSGKYPEYTLVAREWPTSIKRWSPPRLVHPPVYLEDDQLERFGRNYGLLQPAVSAGKFYVGLGMLPVKILKKPPYECQRDSECPRPGSPSALVPQHCFQPMPQPLSLGPVQRLHGDVIRGAQSPQPCLNCETPSVISR